MRRPWPAAARRSQAKLPCLEHSDEAFAWHATEAYLALNTRTLDHSPKAAVAWCATRPPEHSASPGSPANCATGLPPDPPRDCSHCSRCGARSRLPGAGSGRRR
jgi:hypothetical protein